MIYPSLTAKQQQKLPKLIKATPLPALFEDSTHQLWQCDTVDGEMMLKVCNADNVQASSFWQGMALLFNVNLSDQLGEFKLVYDKLSTHSSLIIPDYIASDSAFILTRLIPGSMLDASNVNDEMVVKLSQHISALHQCQQSVWGSLTNVNLTADHWSMRLVETVNQLAKNQSIPEQLLAKAIEQSSKITVENFVPIMPDLRWDQFLQDNGQLSALVDLDAFVFAPRELELVLLEYILDQQQADLFISYYQKSHSLPDLSKVRTAYRLLLFMMNVLGEQDIDVWMQAPTRWL